MPPRPSRTQEMLSLLRQPVLFVWALYLLLSPFYVVRAGLPQPGDLLISILVPLALSGWDGRLPSAFTRVLRTLLLFTLWVCVVNIAWALVLQTGGKSLLFPLYYVYNAAFFLAGLVLFQRFGEPFVRFTVYLVWVTVVFQVAASVVLVGGATRGQLFFSNPNQLGYYALLAGCIIALTQARLGIGLARSAIGLMGCAYLALLSGSRSSVAGIGLLLVLLLLSDPRVIVIGCLGAVGFTVLESPLDKSVETLQQRIAEDRNPGRSFFEERGYDRIWNNSEHLLFGAGEGNSKRFAGSTVIGGAEIHSSIATVLFSYGIPGMALFIAFCLRIVRGVPLRTGLVLLPPLIYTFAHQGLRFTMLWVLLVLFVAFKTALPAPTSRTRAPRRGRPRIAEFS